MLTKKPASSILATKPEMHPHWVPLSRQQITYGFLLQFWHRICSDHGNCIGWKYQQRLIACSGYKVDTHQEVD
jgi:hypothetical protein